MKIKVEFNGREEDKKAGEVLTYISAEFPEIIIEMHNIIEFKAGR